MKPDDFEHFCRILAEFDEGRQEAFDNAWNDGDVASMVAICQEHVEITMK